jgi:hypothetical protein
MAATTCPIDQSRMSVPLRVYRFHPIYKTCLHAVRLRNFVAMQHL